VEEIRKDTEEIVAEDQTAESAEPVQGNTESVQETAVQENAAQENAEAGKLPMKWHKFQKNFLLWVLALFCAVRAFLIISGNIYYGAEIQAVIYAGMPLLRILDYAFAAFALAAGVLAVVSAGRLKKGSAHLLTKLNFAMAAGELAYVLLRWAISGLPPMNVQCAALLIVHVLLWRVNREYYSKRNYLTRKAEL